MRAIPKSLKCGAVASFSVESPRMRFLEDLRLYDHRTGIIFFAENKNSRLQEKKIVSQLRPVTFVHE
jgi:hypothetical protein